MPSPLTAQNLSILQGQVRVLTSSARIDTSNPHATTFVGVSTADIQAECRRVGICDHDFRYYLICALLDYHTGKLLTTIEMSKPRTFETDKAIIGVQIWDLYRAKEGALAEESERKMLWALNRGWFEELEHLLRVWRWLLVQTECRIEMEKLAW